VGENLAHFFYSVIGYIKTTNFKSIYCQQKSI